MTAARNKCRRAGFTLIEAMIAAVLGTILFGSLVMAINRGSGMFEQSVANNDVDARGARALDKIIRNLLAVSTGSLNPSLDTPFGANTVWTSTLDFQEAEGWTGAALQLGVTTRIALEMEDGEIENGIDDNNNGLIDERRVVRIVDPGVNEQRVVLVNGVSAFLEGETADGTDENANGIIDEQGLCFDLRGDTLNVRLSIERIGPGQQLIVRTQVASIALRN